MKKKIKLSYYILNTLLFILSILFAFIELRLIISLDWSIYQDPLFSCIQYLLRFIIACFISALTFIPYINKNKTKRKLSYISWFGSISIFIFGMISSFYVTNYFGEIFLILSCLYFAISSIYYQKGLRKIS